ncbi:MAG: dihydroorotase [Clostridiales bacterium]|nr:dihydroorotase [Clostridiales bacterium]
MKTLIKNGRVIDPTTKQNAIADVLVENDTILAVGPDCSNAVDETTTVINASDWVVAPGLIDTHVHFRDPGFTYKEDIFTGAAAAAKGGFTTVICMANTSPTIDTPERLLANLEKGRQTGIHVLQTAAVSTGLKGEKLTDMKALAAAGAVGFTDDGIPLMKDELVKEAMEISRELDLPISLHEENPAFMASPGVNQGAVSRQLGLGGASALAEDSMVARDCMIALATGARVVIQHISSANSVKMVRAAKAMGGHIYAEATPHHFTLTEEAVLKYGTMARMNPPLRTEEDRMEIIRGLQDGTIDVIATDHAPHSAEEKAKPFPQAPSGITGLETALALGITTLVRGGYLTMMELIDKMSRQPAELYRLNYQGIVPGAPADLVIFAPDETFRIKEDEYASKATNSPFTDWELYGPVKYTFCQGNIVYSYLSADKQNKKENETLS